MTAWSRVSSPAFVSYPRRMLAGRMMDFPLTITHLLDRMIRFWKPVEVRRRIGYMPESCPLYPEMRVSEYLRFRAGIKGIHGSKQSKRLGYVLERCWLKDVHRQLIGTLSKGYRQRVGLADALLADPPVLILDEPTAGLDPTQIRATRQLIRAATLSEMWDLVARVKKIAEGAALMTETKVEVKIVSAVSNVVGNGPLESALQGIMEDLGPPHFDEADQAFARKIRETLTQKDIDQAIAAEMADQEIRIRKRGAA